MAKLFLALLLYVVGAGLLHSGVASAQELEPIGRLPKLEADWEISVDDRQPELKAKLPFRWLVFRHKRTGEFLAFATHPEMGKSRALEYLSDTSLEIFPNGRAVWTQPRVDASVNVVAMKVVDIGRTHASLKGEKVLEHCFISESPDRENLMAHGRVWVGPKGVVFVQHTSGRPITSDLADQTIRSIIQDQKKSVESAPR